MRTKINLLFAVAAISALSLSGCGTTEVAKGQQVTHMATVTLLDFATFERNNREALWKINPEIKHFVDAKLRKRECETCKPNAERYVETAISFVDAYKDHRSPENKANMDTAIAVIQELINQISNYFLDPRISHLDPSTAIKYKPTKIVP